MIKMLLFSHVDVATINHFYVLFQKASEAKKKGLTVTQYLQYKLPDLCSLRHIFFPQSHCYL